MYAWHADVPQVFILVISFQENKYIDFYEYLKNEVIGQIPVTPDTGAHVCGLKM